MPMYSRRAVSWSSTVFARFRESGYGAAALSGLLLGLSFPSYPWIRLELLAWVALVPLFFSLLKATNAAEAFRRSWVAMLIYSAVALWWISVATLPGGLLTILATSLFLTLPFLVLHFLWRRLGRLPALLAFPFVLVGWEWAYMQQDLSFGWLTLGNSQANLLWMVQYADITGVWGISFWLVLLNVSLFLLLSGSLSRKWPAVVLLCLMIALPLLYSAFAFARYGVHNTCRMVRVALVQPDVDPWMKWEQYSSRELMELYYRITGQAVADGKPDLVIWPETAIPFQILEPEYADYLISLTLSLKAWDTSLITGFSDIEWLAGNSGSADASAVAAEVLDQGSPYLAYNASMLLTPCGDAPQRYRKVRLVPFAERVPYEETFPVLERLTVSLAGISSWSRGEGASLLEFRTRSGSRVVTANGICYESIFPGYMSAFVRKGAEFLTLVTNDGWYGTSYGPWQHFAIARLRCIENRRAMARCANTGVTACIDDCGRTISEIPWWQEASLVADVPLRRKMSFYTRYPDMLPKGSLAVAAFFLLAAFWKGRPVGVSDCR